MNADGAFAIGRAHDVCQDYVVAGHYSGTAYAILADGCSSSPDTDVGARLLVKSAARFIRTHDISSGENCARYHAEAVGHAIVQAELLHVDSRCVDATLVTLTAGKDRFFVSCYGDGVFALKKRSGAIEVHIVSFSENAPDYPSYLADARRRSLVYAQSTNEKSVISLSISPTGEVLDRSVRRCVSGAEIIEGRAVELESIAIASDGVQSFAKTVVSETSRVDERLALEQVLPELLAFKSRAGAFVQRRMNRFRRDCVQRGWRHDDDLAIAAIHFGM